MREIRRKRERRRRQDFWVRNATRSASCCGLIDWPKVVGITFVGYPGGTYSGGGFVIAPERELVERLAGLLRVLGELVEVGADLAVRAGGREGVAAAAAVRDEDGLAERPGCPSSVVGVVGFGSVPTTVFGTGSATPCEPQPAATPSASRHSAGDDDQRGSASHRRESIQPGGSKKPRNMLSASRRPVSSSAWPGEIRNVIFTSPARRASEADHLVLPRSDAPGRRVPVRPCTARRSGRCRAGRRGASGRPRASRRCGQTQARSRSDAAKAPRRRSAFGVARTIGSDEPPALEQVALRLGAVVGRRVRQHDVADAEAAQPGEIGLRAEVARRGSRSAGSRPAGTSRGRAGSPPAAGSRRASGRSCPPPPRGRTASGGGGGT